MVQLKSNELKRIMGWHKMLPACNWKYAWPLKYKDIKTFPALLYMALSFREKCLEPWFYEEKENRNISTRQLYVLCQSRGQISEREMTVLSGRQMAAQIGEAAHPEEQQP